MCWSHVGHACAPMLGMTTGVLLMQISAALKGSKCLEALDVGGNNIDADGMKVRGSMTQRAQQAAERLCRELQLVCSVQSMRRRMFAAGCCRSSWLPLRRASRFVCWSWDTTCLAPRACSTSPTP